jgi:hypothetical protein
MPLILIIIINWVVLDYMFCNLCTHITKGFHKLALKLCMPNWLSFSLAQIYRCKAKHIAYYAAWVREWYSIHYTHRAVLNHFHFEHLVLTLVTFLYPVSFVIKKFWAWLLKPDFVPEYKNIYRFMNLLKNQQCKRRLSVKAATPYKL